MAPQLSRHWTLSACLAALLALLLHQTNHAQARDSSQSLIESINKYERCAILASISYNFPDSYPPKSLDELPAMCQQQSDAFKCIKEKTKGGPSLLRRGMMTFVQNRQRFHKKVCSNLQSEQSRTFVEATKCTMGKAFPRFQATDRYLGTQFKLIEQKNFNDSVPELKHVCCTFWNYNKRHTENVGQECPGHKALLMEMIQSVVPSDTSLICEDDDKLAKICPALEPIRLEPGAQATPLANSSASALGLYLVATLGEPRELSS